MINILVVVIIGLLLYFIAGSSKINVYKTFNGNLSSADGRTVIDVRIDKQYIDSVSPGTSVYWYVSKKDRIYKDVITEVISSGDSIAFQVIPGDLSAKFENTAVSIDLSVKEITLIDRILKKEVR